MSEKYTIGIDFGSLSARAVVVRVSDGEILGEAVHEYTHGIMDRYFTVGDGHELPPDFALQVPADYVEAMSRTVPAAVAAAGIDAGDVVGLGLDVTSATVVVTDADARNLAAYPEFADNPHAYIKMWKHHGAQEQTDRIVALAEERGEAWLSRYGGTLSSEMLMPKALELLEKAPEVYDAAAEIMDVLDWLTWKLTGNLVYSAGDSGYKRMYQDGQYPSKDYLAALNPDFADVFETKMSHPVVPLGSKVGGLNENFALVLGLPVGTAVAAGNIDAHVHAPSVGAVQPGQMTGILGTSTCWVLPSTELIEVPGHFGVVDGGIVDGSWGYEAGQSAVGDSFQWSMDNCVPAEYVDEAAKLGVSIFKLMGDKAAAQKVGEHGLVALDWWNGNRSILVDSHLRGLMVGQTLTTRPEDMYRAMLEATAFGARVIIENFVSHGVPVSEIRVAGGLLKDKFLMQMYADILNRPLCTATVVQAGAQGSAIFAAVAAGEYPTIVEASEAMGGFNENAYVPNPEAVAVYDELYAIYRKLYDFFGRDAKDVMHGLTDIREKARGRSGVDAEQDAESGFGAGSIEVGASGD